jgi:hypothetical protein
VVVTSRIIRMMMAGNVDGAVVGVDVERRGRLTLVVVHDVAEMVATAVVGLAHAHRVVREVDIAVIAEN